jgi:hypothetical protein
MEYTGLCSLEGTTPRAGAGNGDYFGFPVVQGVCRPDVFVWNHEDDSRASIARDLRDYLERWADGRLKV